MSTKTCLSCGQAFFPGARAWGDETCGVCIAGRLEHLLAEALPARHRRPMLRGADLAERQAAVPEPAEPAIRRVSGE